MTKKLAFALSGGGARGALQVGALYALLEYGLQPDLLIGVSVGAANASFVALNGFSRDTLDRLMLAWQYAQSSEIMPNNYIWLTVRAMFGRSSRDPSRLLKDFFINHGISPDLRFSDINKSQLVIVSADLNTGEPILYGEQPDDNVLDALLLSTALPPWFMPVRKEDRYLVDGGVVSNLPIEPAIKLGATEIVALDLMDSRLQLGQESGVRHFIDRLIYSIEKRQVVLEMELAEARKIPILYIDLTGETLIPLWDFQHSHELVAQGYEIAQAAIESERFTNPIFTEQDANRFSEIPLSDD